MRTQRILVAAICLALPAVSGSQGAPGAPGSAAKGAFDLDVQKSKFLRVGKSHLETVSAFAVYTNEFFGGKLKGLKVRLFTHPIDEAARARMTKDDADYRELGNGGSAGFVLLLDDHGQLQQANLSVAVPGTTLARTVAANAAELAKYFSDFHYENHRLHLKSKGSYFSDAISKDEAATLSWDVELDVAVVDRIKT